MKKNSNGSKFRLQFIKTNRKAFKQLDNMLGNLLEQMTQRMNEVEKSTIQPKYTKTFKDWGNLELAEYYKYSLEIRGVCNLQALLTLTYEDLIRLKGIGVKTSLQIIKALNEKGLRLQGSPSNVVYPLKKAMIKENLEHLFLEEK